VQWIADRVPARGPGAFGEEAYFEQRAVARAAGLIKDEIAKRMRDQRRASLSQFQSMTRHMRMTAHDQSDTGTA